MNIVITGAGKGIGFAVAKKFLEKGDKVAAVSRNVEKLKLLDFKGLYVSSFDLLQTDYTPLINFINEKFSHVDILINNAGLLINKPFLDFSDNNFDEIFNINVKAAFKLSQALIKYFGNPSHIVNISSMGGVQGSVKFPGLSLYSAAKGALAVLSETMALELKEYGIFVNALALGAVKTEMLEQAFPEYQAPLSPEEMAEFIFDFAVSGYKYFNGKILPVSISTP